MEGDFTMNKNLTHAYLNEITSCINIASDYFSDLSIKRGESSTAAAIEGCLDSAIDFIKHANTGDVDFLWDYWAELGLLDEKLPKIQYLLDPVSTEGAQSEMGAELEELGMFYDKLKAIRDCLVKSPQEAKTALNNLIDADKTVDADMAKDLGDVITLIDRGSELNAHVVLSDIMACIGSCLVAA